MTISELQRSIRIFLGFADLAYCPAIDADLDGRATVAELIAGVNAALGECRVKSKTPCPWTDVDDGRIHVFLMAGQSNMAGQGDPAEVSAELRNGDPHLLRLVFGIWLRLIPRSSFGPELGFAHTIADACPNSTIGIIKLGIPVTGINAWLPDWNEELVALTENNLEFGPIYPLLTERIQIAEEISKVSWEGFVWVQGHSDKAHDILAQGYGDNLRALIDAIREDLASPTLPFVLEHRMADPPTDETSTSAQITGDTPRWRAVELAKWRAQFDIPHAYVADWSTLQYPDAVHSDTEGYLLGGQRLAEVLLAGRATSPEE